MDVIFATEVERLVRQPAEAEQLAERESHKISERIKHKQADRARNGQAHGGHRCFGYKAGNREVEEIEASILREMASKLLDNYSFKEIAYWANEQGYKTAEGRMWYPVRIRNTLRRVRYAVSVSIMGLNSRQLGPRSSTPRPGNGCS